ncbi:MAG: hemin-degrading factor [Alphaproteobacteria bacterium]
MTAAAAAPQDLLERYDALHRDEPRLRLRDAATRLGVSEGELIAARCGHGVIRLNNDWPTLIGALGDLGQVMALTRNDHAVHEKIGRYERISVSSDGTRGLVTGPDIDLRLRLSRWRFAYAVTEESRNASRLSLQFFDPSGTAVHKIFLRDNSNRDGFIRLVAAHAAPRQHPGEIVETRRPRRPAPPEDAVDAATLKERWASLNDVHEFAAMLKAFGFERTRAFRLIGPEYAERLAPSSFVSALEAVAAERLPVMVFVPSGGVVQIHTGPIEILKRVGPWFNVLDPHFNLHLRDEAIADAWLVRKPTRDGAITSLEIFDENERQIGWMFGHRERGAPEREEWRRVLDGLPRAAGDTP